MTKIIVTHENDEMEEFDFDVEIKTITIGRRSTNDVCVPHLSVSGNHCRMLVGDTSTLIEDLNSTNGTYINGRLISKQNLKDGDDIIIGKAKLTFQQNENTSSGIESNPRVAEADEKPLSLAEKAALHKEQVKQGHVAAESEFAGDYCEPDESEIAAMVDSSDLAEKHEAPAQAATKGATSTAVGVAAAAGATAVAASSPS